MIIQKIWINILIFQKKKIKKLKMMNQLMKLKLIMKKLN